MLFVKYDLISPHKGLQYFSGFIYNNIYIIKLALYNLYNKVHLSQGGRRQPSY